MSKHPIPLPYVVRLRVAISDDAVPEVVEHKVVAYSIADAIMQACYRSGSVIGSVVVEDVQADTEAFYRMRAVRKAATQ